MIGGERLDAAPQTDFGRVDSTFPGVILKMANGRVVDLVLGELAGNVPSSSTIDALPEELALEALLAVTARSHELRHFHDQLLSPTGAMQLRARTKINYNVVLLLGLVLRQFHDGGPTVLPYPLPRWCRLSRDEQAQALARVAPLFRAKGTDATPVRLPRDSGASYRPGGIRRVTYDLDALPEFLAYFSAQFREIETMLGGPAEKVELHDRHVREASAVVIQLQALHYTYGPAYVDRLFSSLLVDPRNPYGLVLSALLALGHGRVSLFALSRVICWCVLGDFGHGVEVGSPAVRLGHIFRYVDENGFPPDVLPTPELFEKWDRSAGYPSTSENIAASVGDDERFLTQLRASRDETPDADERDSLAEAEARFSMLAGARRHTVDRFLADPDGYIRPERYAEEARRYVAPPVLLVSQYGLSRPSLDPAWPVVDGWTDEAGDAWVTQVAIPAPATDPSVPIIDVDAAIELYSQWSMSELLFSEFDTVRDPDKLRWLRNVVAEHGVNLLRVFSA